MDIIENNHGTIAPFYKFLSPIYSKYNGYIEAICIPNGQVKKDN